jgi:hypothetical protein
MDAFAPDEELIPLQWCSDHLAAEVVANLLRAESVPAVVRNLAAVPGLEQGAQVLVPVSWRYRAKRILASSTPSDEELTLLATGQLPGKGAPDQAG